MLGNSDLRIATSVKDVGGLIELDMDTTAHRPGERVLENRWTDVSVKGTKLLCVCAHAATYVSVGTLPGAVVSGEHQGGGLRGQGE